MLIEITFLFPCGEIKCRCAQNWREARREIRKRINDQPNTRLIISRRPGYRWRRNR